MNTTIRNLIVAAPLATAALTLVPAAAMASEPGPVIAVPHHVDPQPDLDKLAPAPKPVEPKDKVAAPKPKPTHPDGPGDITNPKPCPTHGVDCTPNDDGGSKDSVDDAAGTVELPTRVDAGLATEEPAAGELDLAWLFAGGLAVTASGVAFAVRKRTGSHM